MSSKTLMDKILVLNGYIEQLGTASFFEKGRIAEQASVLTASILAELVLKLDQQETQINTLEALQDGTAL